MSITMAVVMFVLNVFKTVVSRELIPLHAWIFGVLTRKRIDWFNSCWNPDMDGIAVQLKSGLICEDCFVPGISCTVRAPVYTSLSLASVSSGMFLGKVYR